MPCALPSCRGQLAPGLASLGEPGAAIHTNHRAGLNHYLFRLCFFCSTSVRPCLPTPVLKSSTVIDSMMMAILID